ncbi:SMI1/KNR4 family protein [Pyxidicoccus sp. MSG2]|uniref:SMI1/KNR4 family protein n=1 Tax=Pyxidicoccus sp. MSG2 TaxID=2996790 RepID=UPI002D1E38FD|nr:SMI1/KNR4 family protein [Pyxidicoccus sp. MSG2]
MHEWLEALRKSAKAASPGVPAEEVRRAETECGVPFPEELGALYQALNGGELNGDVHLFQLHGPEGSASVLEKSRLKLVGLPAAGVWRIGLKGIHRHLFTARKSAMVEQGDGGGPLPGWMDPLGDEDWVYGTWDGEKQELRLYRSLKDMLDVLVPPAEVESFGERTFARAMNAVLQGALSGAQADAEEGSEADSAAMEAEATEAAEAEDLGEVRELAYEYDDDSRRRRDEERPFGGKKPKAEPKKPVRPVGMGAGKAKEKPVARAEPRSPDTGGAGVSPPRAASGTGEATETPASEAGAPGEPAAAPAAPEVKGAEVIAAMKKKAAAGKPMVAKKAAAAPATAPAAAKKAPAAPAAAKTAPVSKTAAAPASKQSAAAKKAPVKKAAAKKAPAKKSAAKKSAAKKSAAKKSAAKKSAAKKAPAKKAAAKKAPAKKAPAKKAAAKKAPVKKSAAKKSAAKKSAAKKSAAKKAPVSKGAAKKAAAKKGAKARGR